MQTEKKFVGVVNGHKFDNAEAMNSFIDYCTKNNVSITEFAVSTEQRSCTCRDTCKEDTECKHSEGSLERWPEVYDDVVSYLIPFLSEDTFTEDAEHNRENFQDSLCKLESRVAYVARNMEALQKYVKDITVAGDKKIEWCNKRMRELTLLREQYSKRLERLQAEIEQVTKLFDRAGMIYDSYDHLGGYCTAIEDIIEDATKGEEVTE